VTIEQQRDVAMAPSRAGLSEPQQRYVAELAGGVRARAGEVKRLNGRYPRRLAESRAWANFHPALKELLHPIVVERAAGALAWDQAGNAYTDYCMGLGVHFFGHSPEFVTEAVRSQLARTYSIGHQIAQTYELADQLGQITGHDRVTFCCTGSEAVLGAMRLARLATGRRKIAYFRRSYHGLSDVVLATEAGAAADPAPRAASGLSPGSVGEAIVLPYGADSALDTLRAQACDIAAVLVEPVQNRDLSVQPASFLRRLRELATATGMVLVFDEMITGFRIGLRGAQGYFGIQADLATYGKILGGGLPIAAIAGSAELMDGMDGGSWGYDDDSAPTAPAIVFGGTFQKHPLAMSAASAVLTYLQTRGEDLYTEVNGRALQTVTALDKIFIEEGLPYSVAAFGSVWRIEYHGPPDPAQPLQFDMLYHSLLAEGIYVWKGRSFFLSTAHTDAHVEQLLAAVRRSISRLRAVRFLPPAGQHEAAGSRG
jgi:iturin family lipopeptide synthetase A